MSDRDQDIAIAKAMGIEVVMWPYMKNPECGGFDPIDEDLDTHEPDFELSLGDESEFARIRKANAVWLPSYRFVGGHNIPEDRDWYDHRPIPDYSTPEGSWKILEYVGNTSSRFAYQFALKLTNLMNLSLLEWDNMKDPALKVHTIVSLLTPSLIKEAAYEAAKEVNP